jgi:ankyrin repeat protein
MLLKHPNINVNLKNNNNDTAFILATKKSYQKVIKLLSEHPNFEP